MLTNFYDWFSYVITERFTEIMVLLVVVVLLLLADLVKNRNNGTD